MNADHFQNITNTFFSFLLKRSGLVSYQTNFRSTRAEIFQDIASACNLISIKHALSALAKHAQENSVFVSEI